MRFSKLTIRFINQPSAPLSLSVERHVSAGSFVPPQSRGRWLKSAQRTDDNKVLNGLLLPRRSSIISNLHRTAAVIAAQKNRRCSAWRTVTRKNRLSMPVAVPPQSAWRWQYWQAWTQRISAAITRLHFVLRHFTVAFTSSPASPACGAQTAL